MRIWIKNIDLLFVISAILLFSWFLVSMWPEKTDQKSKPTQNKVVLTAALHPKFDDVLALGGYFGSEAPSLDMQLANADNSYLAVKTKLGQKLIRTTTESTPVYSLAWSCTEYDNYLAVGNYDRVSVWSLKSIRNEPPRSKLRGIPLLGDGSFRGLHPRSQADEVFGLKNKGTDRLMWLRPDHSGPVNCLAFSPDGQFLASGDGEGRINLWYSWNGQKVWHEEGIDASKMLSLAFSNDKNYRLAVGGVLWPVEGYDNAKSVLRIYRFAHDHQLELAVDLGDLLPHTPDVTIHDVLPITVLAWSPDGKILASGTRRKVFLWDVKHKIRLLSFDTDFDVDVLAFSPDGRELAAAGGKNVKRWYFGITVKNDQLLSEESAVDATIHSLRFNKRGALLLGTDKGILIR